MSERGLLEPSTPTPTPTTNDDEERLDNTSTGMNGDHSEQEDEAKRRREIVQKLVDDIHRMSVPAHLASSQNHEDLQELVLTSTVAVAIELGMERDFYAELKASTTQAERSIASLCHQHSDAFLQSIGKVVALGALHSSLQQRLEQFTTTLHPTVESLRKIGQNWEDLRMAQERARAMQAMVLACRKVASLLERARKQASLCRPRAALDAVDEARSCLTAPVRSLLGLPSKDERQLTLEDTPFGRRAMTLLPNLEKEVLLGVKKGLVRWFRSLRDEGANGKAGAAALRQTAHSMAEGGPARLGPGGREQAYEWSARVADVLIARTGQGPVGRACRQGYWHDRDIHDALHKLASTKPGLERRAEALALAFGWYRCWAETAPIGVELTSSTVPTKSTEGSSLGFRASSSSSTQNSNTTRQWAQTLTPQILLENPESPTYREEAEVLASLSESVHPVRLAESGFALQGRLDEFKALYEQNRYGRTKTDNNYPALSSLTGQDVGQGSDRFFFAKSLPHLCASVVGFSAVEAALEIGTFDETDVDDSDQDNDLDNSSAARQSFLESSAKHERVLIKELGQLLERRVYKATLAELARSSSLMVAFRSALKIVHPSSSSRKSDKELLAMNVETVMTALKVAQVEQQKATEKIVKEDSSLAPVKRRRSRRYPTDTLSSSAKSYHLHHHHRSNQTTAQSPRNRSFINTGTHNTSPTKSIPAEEVVDFPFGLDALYSEDDTSVQTFEKTDDMDEMDIGMRRTPSLRRDNEQIYPFSQTVPNILRSIHGRTIAFAAFALSQQELGQVFAKKKEGGVAGYVLDCLDQCVQVATVNLKLAVDVDSTSNNVVERVVRVTANLTALQKCLPRLFGTITRGMCHAGILRGHRLHETFEYADQRLKGSDIVVDQELNAMNTLLYDACKTKIDELIDFSLQNFQWVARAERTQPNQYAESLIEYMRSTFKAIHALDEGSKAGLHFSCCGRIAERLLGLLVDKPDTPSSVLSDYTSSLGSSSLGSNGNQLPPIQRIDGFGLHNLSLDVAHLQKYADETGVPQLGDCFNELKCITAAMVDRDLPLLLAPANLGARLKKYPFLSLDLLGNVLEKYSGIGLGMKMMKSGGKSTELLLLEKKEASALLKLVREQT